MPGWTDIGLRRRRTAQAGLSDQSLRSSPVDELRTHRLVSETHGEPVPSANGAGAHALGVPLIDLPAGKTRQDLLERDTAFEPRQRRPQAEVQPISEGEVVIDLAADVEAVGIREPAIVPVRRGCQ